jgi:hypothetical protein
MSPSGSSCSPYRSRCASPARSTASYWAKSKHIPGAELLRRTFAIQIVCPKSHAQLRLIALIKTQDVIKRILVAMHLPAQAPELHPARPPPEPHDGEGPARGAEDWVS